MSCKQEFQVKGYDFKQATSIQTQLNARIYLNEEEILLKKKIEESIKIFYSMYEDFTSGKNKLDLNCYDHFAEIRRKIDVQREELKEKIDDIYFKMIEKIKEVEASYSKSLNEIKSLEIKSIETEETFRDPNLLIETIRDLSLKQTKSIEIIQSTLDQMVEVKEHLKASYEFSPSLSFNEDIFGRLILGEYSNFDPFKSQILNVQQSMQLIKLCEFGIKDKFKLLYKASQDGFRSYDFHSRCDGKANTLTILKASESEFIFGGFTSATSDSSDQQIRPKCFFV